MTMRTLISTLLLCFNTYAQVWKPISPFKKCDEFKIHYQQLKNKTYLVKIKIDNEDEIFEVANINDLSVITDEISIASSKVCKLNQITPHDVTTCNPNLAHSIDYKSFIEQSAQIVSKVSGENKCDQLNDYLELQTKIDGLGDIKELSVKKSKNFTHMVFKLLGEDSTDEMIDLYNACGKKKQSHKFLKNMILLEVKNNCIAPAPPGYLSFEDAQTIAEQISEKYKNLSLVQINAKRKRIEDEAITTFTDIALESEITTLVGDYIPNINKFIGDLKSYDKFKKKSKKTDSTQYLNNIFKPDVTLEIANKILPVIVKGSLVSKLPSGLTENEKEKILEEMLERSQKQYDQCMKPHYQKIAYDEKKSNKELIKIRSLNREKYCENNKEQCDESSCTGVVNMFSDSPFPTDTDIIQGCVMGAVTVAIKPAIDSSVEIALSDIKHDYKLSNEDIDAFKEATWDELLSCSMRNISKSYNIVKSDTPSDLINNPKYLQGVPTPNFEKVLTRCSGAAEMKVSRDVVSLSLKNHAALKSLFSESSQVSYKDTDYNSIDELVSEINATTYTSCVNSQQLKALKDPNFTPSAMLCRPAIEISAASVIINQELENTFTGSKVRNTPRAQLVLKQFENCASESKQDTIDQIGSAKTNHLISNDDQATNYLDNESNFYTCVKDALLATSSIVAEHEYEITTKDAKDLVTKPSTVTMLKTQLGQNVKECFEDGLKDVSNWSEFLEFNDVNGIDKVKKVCSKGAEEFAVSSIVYKETIDTLKPLIKDKYLKSKKQDVGSIMAHTAAKLRRKYNIDLPEHIKGDEIILYSISKAYTKYSEESGSSLDEYINEYSHIATKYAVRRIHKNLNNDIGEKASSSAGLKDFSKAFSAQCIESVYTKFMKNAPTKENGMKMSDLADYISTGINYAQEVSSDFLERSLTKLKSQCENMDQYTNESQFEKSELYKLIIRGQLYELFSQKFSSSLLDNIDEQIGQVKAPYANIKRTALNHMRKNMVDLLDKEINDPKMFEENIMKDGEIIKFALDNIEALQADDEEVLSKITKKLIKKAFENPNDGKLADEFARINIEANVALGGVSDAVDRANDGGTLINLFGHRIGPNYFAMEEARKLFGSPSRISSIIDWENISQAKRRQYQDGILNHAVLITLEENDSFNTENTLQSLFLARVNNHPYRDIDYMAGSAQNIMRSDVQNKFYNDLSALTLQIHIAEKNSPNTERSIIIKKEANILAKYILLSTPDLKVDLESLSRAYTEKYHENELNKEVESELLSYKYSNGKTIEEKIEDVISTKTKERMFGTKEQREKNKKKRLWRQATSKWPIGSKI